MSERLPYEDQLLRKWEELPLPGADKAWADMKRRLDEEDDDPVIIPWWRRGCAVWGLLLFVLLGLGWWYWHAQQQPGTKQIPPKQQEQMTTPAQHPGPGKKDTSLPVHTDHHPQAVPTTGSSRATAPGSKGSATSAATGHDRPAGNHPARGQKPASIKFTQASAQRTVPVKQTNEPGGHKENTIDPGISRSSSFSDTVHRPEKTKDTLPVADSPGLVKKDTLVKSSKKPAAPQTDQPAEDSVKPVRNFFSAGLALYQQLPLDSQRMIPYNALGRKGTLADYIPAVYVRFHHGNKWFVQTGFRYGAPQYTRALTYEMKKNTTLFRDTTSILKKTYYHQLPLSFHYSLLPGLTVGAGVIWNKFSSAVVQQIVVKPPRATPIDTLVSDIVFRIKKPGSQFSKSYFQVSTELQYQWKRFTLGAAYSFGLQPYLRFTLPGGTEQQERNRSLQVFLRYELWRSPDH